MVTMLVITIIQPGVKVSRNAPKRRSWDRKFKPGAFRLRNYSILQPEPTWPSNYLRYIVIL